MDWKKLKKKFYLEASITAKINQNKLREIKLRERERGSEREDIINNLQQEIVILNFEVIYAKIFAHIFKNVAVGI
jgi:hypothetical protein